MNEFQGFLLDDLLRHILWYQELVRRFLSQPSAHGCLGDATQPRYGEPLELVSPHLIKSINCYNLLVRAGCE